LAVHEPDELRRGIEDNLRSLGVEQLAAVNLRVMDSESADPSWPPHLRHEEFDRQLAAMMEARDEGLVSAIGLSNITHEQLVFALERTAIVCVQNAFNLVLMLAAAASQERQGRRHTLGSAPPRKSPARCGSRTTACGRRGSSFGTGSVSSGFGHR